MAFFAMILLITSAHAEVNETLSCEKIYNVYSTCKMQQFSVRNRIFEFLVNKKRVPVPCSDGKELGFYDRLENMDVSSTLSIPYTKGKVLLPEKRRNWDPGRLRVEALFKATYGANESQVRERLVLVNFLNQTVKFQEKLGAAAALERVGIELQAEATRDASLKRFLAPFLTGKEDLTVMTFYWRNVAGSARLSAHSFGTAIDMITDESAQYWLWDEKKVNPAKAALGEAAYKNDHYIPQGVPKFHAKAVEIFERNGFIWGGKWNHYDTMHFEYRPEFFADTQIDCAERKKIQQAGAGEDLSSLFEMFKAQKESPLLHDH